MLLGAAAFTNEEATMKTLAIMLQLEKCILLVNEKKERKEREGSKSYFYSIQLHKEPLNWLHYADFLFFYIFLFATTYSR